MNGKIAVVPDVTLYQEYMDTFRRGEYFEPEKALLRAILEDALHCYEKYRTAENRAGRKQFQEVEQWIMSPGGEWIFSFENVCELLGLDPRYVRDRLPKQKAKTRKCSRQPSVSQLEIA